MTGTWQGTLSAAGAELRIVFHIERGADGALEATMDSPDQGATGISVSAARLEEDSLHLEVAAVGGAYAGALSADGHTIDGTWTQAGQAFSLVLQRSEEEIAAPRRPQEPAPPFPYEAEDVSFENEAAGLTLAGTLTLPEGAGPHPAVVLISGSGAQDRDETLMGHKPFLVLADHLTRQGVAVLRYDERGVGASEGAFAGATSEDFAADVGAAVGYLKTRPEIDTAEIGLVGHSEGGLVAPMVSARQGSVAFLVLMAGPGVTGEEIIYRQAALMYRAGGADTAVVAQNRAVQEQMFQIVKTMPDSAAAAEKLTVLLKEQGVPPQMAEQQAQAVNSPWMRFFLTYDPAPALRVVDVPVLAVNGSKDVQVDAEQNLPAIAAALKAGGNSDYETMKLQGLNHLFQPAETGSPMEYGQIETTIAPAALKTISDWILAHTNAGTQP